MKKYLIVIEKAGKNWSAYVPDLPGCVATGKTRLLTQKEIQSAIKLHLQGMKEDKIAVPRATAQALYVNEKTAIAARAETLRLARPAASYRKRPVQA